MVPMYKVYFVFKLLLMELALICIPRSTPVVARLAVSKIPKIVRQMPVLLNFLFSMDGPPENRDILAGLRMGRR